MMSDPAEQFPMPEGLKLVQPQRLMSLLTEVEPIGTLWSRFAQSLLTNGRLSPQLRELVILRVAWRRRCRYALHAHLVLARFLRLSEAAIATALGKDVEDALSTLDVLLLLASDELIAEGSISLPTRKKLERHLDHASIVELTMLVGQYVLVAMVCETFALDPD